MTKFRSIVHRLVKEAREELFRKLIIVKISAD